MVAYIVEPRFNNIEHTYIHRMPLSTLDGNIAFLPVVARDDEQLGTDITMLSTFFDTACLIYRQETRGQATADALSC